jgi:LEA14-like dessication related protein
VWLTPVVTTQQTSILALALCASCSLLHPDPPVITPRGATVVSVSSSGIGLRVDISVRNTNRISLTAQTTDVRLTLAGRDLGMTHITQPTELPSNVDVAMTLPVTAPWQDLPGILIATVLNENIPYHLDGVVRVGGERLNVDVPFQIDSTLPRSVLTGTLPTIR